MKMKFRTEIEISLFDFKIGHQDRLMMVGSCFTENISKKMESAGFSVCTNPSGIVYNPASISNNIQAILQNKKYVVADLFEHQGLYHSFEHHGRFSGISAEDCVAKMNKEIENANDYLKTASILIITFGTAFAYTLKSTGEIVANCHKLPEKMFCRKRLSVSEIIDEWDNLIALCQKYNPELKMLFTVSPIRHWKDGAHENQLSKSTLLLAIDELIKQNNQCYYFPSYELVMDDLRDYRFYADDMLHPSDLAVDYIWEKFSQSFFNKKTITLIDEWQKIQQALSHKPFNPDSKEHKQFLVQTEIKLKDFLNNNKEFIQ